MGGTLPPSRVLWLEDRPAFQSDILPEAVEVAVVGAGLTGVCVALQLARRGIRVLLLERHTPAQGASGRNAGHLLAGTAEYYSRAVELMGRGKAASFWAFTEESRRGLAEELLASGLETGYQQSGYLACAQSDTERRELEHSVQLLREDGQPDEFWSGEQLARRYGRSPFVGARFSPDDGMVQPAWAVWALLAAYRREKGRLVCGCDVQDAVENVDGIRLDLNLAGRPARLAAQAVVWCLNAWTGERLPGFAERIQPVRGQMLATERLHKVIPMAMAANFGYEYWRQAPRGEVVLGGWRWSQLEAELGQFSEQLNPEIHAGLEIFLRSSFPKLQQAAVRQAWTGVMGFSRDGLPWVGEVPGRSGQFLAAGFTGHGFGLAWHSARCLVDELLDGRLQRDLHWFRPRRDA